MARALLWFVSHVEPPVRERDCRRWGAARTANATTRPPRGAEPASSSGWLEPGRHERVERFGTAR